MKAPNVLKGILEAVRNGVKLTRAEILNGRAEAKNRKAERIRIRAEELKSRANGYCQPLVCNSLRWVVGI